MSDRTSYLVNEINRQSVAIRSAGKTPGRIMVDGHVWWELVRIESIYGQVFISATGEQYHTLFGLPVLISTVMKHGPELMVQAKEDYDNYAYLKWMKRNENSI
jgi:hypothetical protein